MSTKTITLYYICIGALVMAQTIATVLTGGSVVLNSSTIAELKHERQSLLLERQTQLAELAQHTALSALPITTTDQYTPIAKPLVVVDTTTVASTQP